MMKVKSFYVCPGNDREERVISEFLKGKTVKFVVQSSAGGTKAGHLSIETTLTIFYEE